LSFKNYFLIIPVFSKISQIVVFPCMTARKYSWNGGGGRAQGGERDLKGVVVTNNKGQ
jgi:hypothetical protein